MLKFEKIATKYDLNFSLMPLPVGAYDLQI
jgi:hypothetical protein